MSFRIQAGLIAITVALIGLGGCMSPTVWKGTHEGVRYVIHRDQKLSRIAKTGPFMYDSTELTVVVDHGAVSVNGKTLAHVKSGDRLEVTAEGMVTVNGSVIYGGKYGGTGTIQQVGAAQVP
ncbi:hypothetical protein [Maioricimonas sp. JC845]|uniref:hypothetical protein n=1 Tax=Maioricimonas sp. JC845 TaxID=3232138 RepID=UPI00345B0032